MSTKNIIVNVLTKHNKAIKIYKKNTENIASVDIIETTTQEQKLQPFSKLDNF